MPGVYEDEYRRAYHRAYQDSVMMPEPFGVPVDQLLKVTGSRRQTRYRTAICDRCGYQRDSHDIFPGACSGFVKPPKPVTLQPKIMYLEDYLKLMKPNLNIWDHLFVAVFLGGLVMGYSRPEDHPADGLFVLLTLLFVVSGLVYRGMKWLANR